MITIVLAILISLGFTYFATQNTAPITVRLGEYMWMIPMYVLSLGSLVVGLAIAAFFGALDEIGSALTIFNKDSALKREHASVVDLRRRLAHLEEENAELKGENREAHVANFKQKIENTGHRTRNFFDRFRHAIAH